jgi:hypothetical protein
MSGSVVYVSILGLKLSERVPTDLFIKKKEKEKKSSACRYNIWGPITTGCSRVIS